MSKAPSAKRLRQQLLKFASSTAIEKYNGNHYVFARPIWMYRPVKQRHVEHFAFRSKWLSSSVLQQFRDSDLFRADLCMGYWTARSREKSRWHGPTNSNFNVPANNAQQYFKRALYLLPSGLENIFDIYDIFCTFSKFHTSDVLFNLG